MGWHEQKEKAGTGLLALALEDGFSDKWGKTLRSETQERELTKKLI